MSYSNNSHCFSQPPTWVHPPGTSGGVDAVLEKHLQHVAHAGRQLQSKVEEQEEIIEAACLRAFMLEARRDWSTKNLQRQLLQGSRVESVALETKYCI